MNRLFDVAIIGHNSDTFALAKSFPKDIDATIIFEALYIDYKSGLFITTDQNKETICSKAIIITKSPVAIKHYPEAISIKDYKDINKILDKNIFIVGAGETGVDFALWAEKIAKNVYICDKEIDPTCKKELASRLRDNLNITFLPNCTITKINEEDNKLKSVELSTYTTIECDFIYEAIGYEPKIDEFKRFIEISKDGYLKVNNNLESNLVPGVFAIGNSTTRKYTEPAKITLIENIKKFLKK